MLKDLQININKRKTPDIKDQSKSSDQGPIHIAIDRQHALTSRTAIQNIDTELACNIIDHMFTYIHSCVESDKSKVKLNLLTKSFVKGLLSNGVKNGMKDFIKGMPDPEAKALLDAIHKEVNKRAK